MIFLLVLLALFILYSFFLTRATKDLIQKRHRKAEY
ncbi:hypothetical protein RSC3_04326 [Bacillus paralicheniformis]|nr:hypothetical protein RSC3_04326 [Bacillus paralicheniformis]